MTSLPAGPTTPAIVQGTQFAFWPDRFFSECARRYGDPFTLRMPVGVPFVLYSAPAAVKEIFTADEEDLRGGEANEVLRPVVGPLSILFLDGPPHERARRLMMPPFHGERMLAYGAVMREIVDAAIDRWPVGRPFPIQDEMQAITLDVILRTVFGVEGARMAELRDLVRRYLSIGANPMLLWPALHWELGGWSPWGRLVRVRRRIDELLRAEFVRRRAQDAPAHDDVLSLLVAARDEDGRPMSDEELCDEMMTLLLAGHETTATALSWTVHRILENPDVRARLREEIHGVVGTGGLAPEHVQRLEYVDATIKETLRLNPVIPDVGRRLAKPMRIGGVDLPAGVAVAPCIYLTHRRPDVWPDPLRFDPTRFLGKRPNPYEFFPFGGGVRRCLGMAFSLFEMKVVLAQVLARVELAPVPGYEVRLVRRSVTFAPSEGMPVVVQRRAA
jgi:cytochrome P450